MQQVERAIFDLRRGIPVLIRDESDTSDEGVIVYPVESVAESSLDAIARLAGHAPALTVTRHRMAAMGLDATDQPATLPFRDPAGLDAEGLYRAAASADARPEALFAAPRPARTSERAALKLLRRALLLPAALTAPVRPDSRSTVSQAVADARILSVSAEAAERSFDSGVGMLHRVSEAEVPLAESVRSRFILFREPDGLREHVAVEIGERSAWPDAVPVRMHSSCLTGDLFGSLRCDCGEQLQNAVRTIAEMGGGVLLYLAQEGRGIGLANKLRAYELQDEGLDTVDADRVLGFGEDNRRYRVAVDMLSSLSIERVTLLTNNPTKVRALNEGGIDVAARDSLFGRVTQQNRRYLKAKASRSGHLLDEVLGQ
jgi:GTP cyclohydrolase II